ncbi:MAG: sigma-54 interaction domain-containing protein [Candidatus Poribacteria bacterium]
MRNRSNSSSLHIIQKQRYSLDSIIGESPPIRRLKEYIRKITRVPQTSVLIQGETGTGKELIARCIHYKSCQSGEPFIEVNSGAIPETLLEAELFGYEQGAFTDAKMRRKGYFEMANRGTLFLDEIAHLKTELQAKLLKAVEEKSFRRVGGTEEIKVSVRIIAATNADIDKAVDEGTFREDLYYRLNVVSLIVPPLRDRGMDVIHIANYFIAEFNEEYGMNIKGLSSETEKRLLEYDWPGNVRELKNVILRAVLLESKDVILPEHINLQRKSKETPAIRIDESGEIVINMPPDGISMQKLERKLLETALIEANWNQTKAAELLYITRDTMRHRMKKYGLKRKPR